MINYLEKMLYALTSAYSRTDYENQKRGSPMTTNIGKLFSLLSWGLSLVDEQAEKIKLWDNLDNACGEVLDRYGANFGVERNGMSDAFYRLAISIKNISQLTNGDDDSVISAASGLLDVDPSAIELENIYPAKINLYVEARVLSDVRLELVDHIQELIKRILPAGVGFVLYLVYLYTYVIEVSSEINLYPYDVPHCGTIYCGTYPIRATLGSSTSATIKSSPKTSLLTYTPPFAGTQPDTATLGSLLDAIVNSGVTVADFEYVAQLCGVNPDTATLGYVQQNNVGADSSILSQLYAVASAGTTTAGTTPQTASVGQTMTISAGASAIVEDYEAEPSHTGTESCGTVPKTTGTGTQTDSTANVTATVEAYVTSAKACGTKYCGQS